MLKHRRITTRVYQIPSYWKSLLTLFVIKASFDFWVACICFTEQIVVICLSCKMHYIKAIMSMAVKSIKFVFVRPIVALDQQSRNHMRFPKQNSRIYFLVYFTLEKKKILNYSKAECTRPMNWQSRTKLDLSLCPIIIFLFA